MELEKISSRVWGRKQPTKALQTRAKPWKMIPVAWVSPPGCLLQQKIRMVEVSGSVGYIGEILPYRFEARPDLDIPYATSVVLLSEQELTELPSKQATLKTLLSHYWG